MATLFSEVEHWMGIHLQQRDAKKELLTITMRSDEQVSKYYHRIFLLWQKAKTPNDERIDKFLVTLKPYISTPLMNRRFSSIRKLLDKARLIEDRQKEVSTYHPWPDRQTTLSKNTNRDRGNSSRHATTSMPSAAASKTTRPTTTQSNIAAVTAPTATKLTGWAGTWYDPESNPKMLEGDDRQTLTQQGCCWACRGSGHRGADSVCP